MFIFITMFILTFIVIMSYGGSLDCVAKVSDSTKCMSLNNELFLAIPTLINLNPNKLHYYPFMVNANRLNGSCNTFDDPYGGICVSNKTEDGKLNCFDNKNKLIENINKTYFTKCFGFAMWFYWNWYWNWYLIHKIHL